MNLILAIRQIYGPQWSFSNVHGVCGAGTGQLSFGRSVTDLVTIGFDIPVVIYAEEFYNF